MCSYNGHDNKFPQKLSKISTWNKLNEIVVSITLNWLKIYVSKCKNFLSIHCHCTDWCLSVLSVWDRCLMSRVLVYSGHYFTPNKPYIFVFLPDVHRKLSCYRVHAFVVHLLVCRFAYWYIMCAYADCLSCTLHYLQSVVSSWIARELKWTPVLNTCIVMGGFTHWLSTSCPSFAAARQVVTCVTSECSV